MSYLSTSEYVTSGHPDRLADNLAACVIQDIQRADGPDSHAAIEVFLTHNSVIFGGEATTSLNINKAYLKGVVAKAFSRSGYLPSMRKFWKKNEVMLAKDMKIVNNICAQSPDIALGTTDKGVDSGWNDQNVSFSSSEATKSMMGVPMEIAALVGEELRVISRASVLQSDANNSYLRPILGPDIKVLATVEVDDDGYTALALKAMTIAIPHTSFEDVDAIREYVKTTVSKLIQRNYPNLKTKGCEWVINGTGRFVVHGCISDTSMTGRKISVNHPSAGPVWANKMIGGGSLVKPWHASDLILNIAARYVANLVVASGLSSYAVVGTSGAIGQNKLQSLFIFGDKNFESTKNKKVKEKVLDYFMKTFDWKPSFFANEFGMFSECYDFFNVVDGNFFGHPTIQPWENMSSKKSKKYIEGLLSYVE